MRTNLAKLNLRSRGRRGNVIIELALLAMPLTVMLLGTAVVGINLGRSIHGAQVNRDAGSMFVRGIDFSTTSNKNLLVRLSQGLGMTATGGDGVVYFTKVTWLSQAKCTALAVSGCSANKHVITQRLTVGNTSKRASTLGTPIASLLDTKGLVTNYYNTTSTIAYFPWMTLADNEYAYVAETYFSAPAFNMPGYQNSTGVYSISIY